MYKDGQGTNLQCVCCGFLTLALAITVSQFNLLLCHYFSTVLTASEVLITSWDVFFLSSADRHQNAATLSSSYVKPPRF